MIQRTNLWAVVMAGALALALFGLFGCGSGSDGPTKVVLGSTTTASATRDNASYGMGAFIVHQDPPGPYLNLPAIFSITIGAPASSTVSVIADNNVPVATLTATDANGKVVFTLPLTTGAGTVQTLNAGRSISHSVQITASQFPARGTYQITAAFQTPGSSTPLVVGSIPLTVQ